MAMHLTVRHLASLAAAGLAATLLGCGHAPSAENPGAPATPSGAGPAAKLAPSVHTMPIPTDQARLLSSLTDNDTTGLVSAAWSLQKINDADRTVLAVVELGGCRQPRGSQVTYTRSAVTVGIFTTPQSPGLCTSQAVYLIALVPLREAVGNRPVLHAAVSSVS
jgi:hypothetical protein